MHDPFPQIFKNKMRKPNLLQASHRTHTASSVKDARHSSQFEPITAACAEDALSRWTTIARG